jgi:hypothetical protein
MTLSRAAFVARVRHLAGTLGDLKHRVRAAVAAETGKAVADAVKDLLTAALGGPTGHDPYRPPPSHPSSRRDWDDRDRWDD